MPSVNETIYKLYSPFLGTVAVVYIVLFAIYAKKTFSGLKSVSIHLTALAYFLSRFCLIIANFAGIPRGLIILTSMCTYMALFHTILFGLLRILSASAFSTLTDSSSLSGLCTCLRSELLTFSQALKSRRDALAGIALWNITIITLFSLTLLPDVNQLAAFLGSIFVVFSFVCGSYIIEVHFRSNDRLQLREELRNNLLLIAFALLGEASINLLTLLSLRFFINFYMLVQGSYWGLEIYLVIAYWSIANNSANSTFSSLPPATERSIAPSTPV